MKTIQMSFLIGRDWILSDTNKKPKIGKRKAKKLQEAYEREQKNKFRNWCNK